jgi:hypothetical protein
MDTTKRRSFEESPAGAQQRAELTGHFWETLHIDLRTVDTADFITDQHLQRRNSSRNRAKPTRAQACPVRQPAGRISDLRSWKRAPHHAKPARDYEPLVHAAGRRRELFRRVRFPVSAVPRALWTEGHVDRRSQAEATAGSAAASISRIAQQETTEQMDNKLKKFGHSDDWLLGKIEGDGTVEEAHG